MLHNLCIATNDPCNPRWILEVENLQLLDKNLPRLADKNESVQNSNKIGEWLRNQLLH